MFNILIFSIMTTSDGDDIFHQQVEWAFAEFYHQYGIFLEKVLLSNAYGFYETAFFSLNLEFV